MKYNRNSWHFKLFGGALNPCDPQNNYSIYY